MRIDTEEELLDLLAAASFNQFITVGGKLRWSVRLARRLDSLAPQHISHDPVQDWEVESFQLERTL